MKTKLLFVTDPLCSWCWGTLPEVLSAREQMAQQVEFDLIMGGLQIGPPTGLVEYDKQRLRRLWQEVTNVTGRTFSGKIPEDFVYHSEVACRAVEIARNNTGGPPWDFFYQLQASFYEDGLDISQPAVLANLLQIDEVDVSSLISDSHFVDAVRRHFELAASLSASALPTILLDTGEGYKLLSGGYITAEYLVAEIEHRMEIK